MDQHPVRRIRSAAVVVGMLACLDAHSQSSLQVNFKQTGGNVTATVDGAIDTRALTYLYTSPFQSQYETHFFVVGQGAYGDFYDGLTADPLYSTWNFAYSGPTLFPDSNFGTEFGLNPDITELMVGVGYNSGSPITGGSVWNGQSFQSMALTPGTYRWTYGASGSNEILVTVGAVPEPGEWAAMGILGAGLVGLVLRKRRTA